MKTPTTPQGLPPLPAAFGYLCDWGNDSLGLTRQTVYYGEPGSATENDWNEFPKVHKNEPIFTAGQMQDYAIDYAREALAAQAATLEAICKIIECAGPEAADEIADLLGYPSVEWPSDQAASVEPVGKIINSGGNTGSLPEHPLLVWLGGVPPVGTELYAGAPPAHIPADVEASGWCEYVAGMVGHWVRSDEYAGIKADEDRCTKAIAGIIERRLWALKHSPQPQAVVASSPAQAVDAVDGLREALRMGVECLRNQKSLHPEDFDELDERAVALLKAALATKEPK